jgi:endonuclease/exonuclease/phosphatase family metal-dependent hydrolase
MTYDLHSGFNTKGKLNIEEIARVIENNRPDIVALQEVSRGWVVNGGVDMLEWLSKRLNMPYVFEPTADPFWGNAILSRYPILAYSKEDLTPPNLLVHHGFVTALIDIGNGENLKVITTDLQDVTEDVEIRQSQSRTITNFLKSMDDKRIVIMGDMNAQPNGPEILMFRQANLTDVGERIKPHLTYTFASDNPNKRIDYIWISPDLQAQDVSVPLSTASDHLPVVAVIDK